MAFEIEKGILPQQRVYPRELIVESKIGRPPLPNKGVLKRRGSIYPFGKMIVGDSFIISDRYSRQLHQTYGNAARNYKNKSPNKSHWKFSVRRWNENQIRVWRVA